MELGTSRIKKYLAKINNPQNDLKIIHITGTNGKGSVTRIITTILSAAAEQTFCNIGSFTSPALLSPNDCIQINCKPITMEHYISVYSKINDEQIQLTNFEKEVITAIVIFKKYSCDVCVIEVGMGGIDDATNIFEDIWILLVTSISFDHEKYLGFSLEEIITKKMGLAKRSRPVMVIRQDNILVEKEIKGRDIECIFEKYCRVNNIKHLIFVDKACKRGNQCCIETEKGQVNYKLLMNGDFQLANSSLAVNCILYLKQRYKEIPMFRNLTYEHIKRGCSRVNWPGRMTWIYKNLLIDGAHNLQGIHELMKYVRGYARNKNIESITWIMAITQGKNYKKMIDVLTVNKLSKEQSIIFSEFESPVNMPWIECIPSNDLRKYADNAEKKTLKSILDNLQNKEKHIYVICGSLYLISAVYKFLKIDPWV